jgi:hypothetical protein
VADKTTVLGKLMRGLRDRSKRDPSTSRADFFAGAKKKKKRRPASVGMTVALSEMTVGCLMAVCCTLVGFNGCVLQVGCLTAMRCGLVA